MTGARPDTRGQVGGESEKERSIRGEGGQGRSRRGRRRLGNGLFDQGIKRKSEQRAEQTNNKRLKKKLSTVEMTNMRQRLMERQGSSRLGLGKPVSTNFRGKFQTDPPPPIFGGGNIAHFWRHVLADLGRNAWYAKNLLCDQETGQNSPCF